MSPVDTTKAAYTAFARNGPSVLFGAMAAGGARLDAAFCHVWRFRDGRIVAFQQYTDTAQWARLMA